MTDEILPYLTRNLPGVAGTLKAVPEDFRVDELPLYPACGDGTHVYVRIEKRGIPTPAAIARLARHMDVRPGDFGVAGLKDAQAITTQWLSLEHADPQKLSAYDDGQLRVVETARHTNKLRTGHLAANRFAIRLRDVRPDEFDRAREALNRLTTRGVPNYFGVQRFGFRGDTAELGEALVRGDRERFVRIFLGEPMTCDDPDCRAARDAFDVGALGRALKRWPRHFADQRRALNAYKSKRRPAAAIAAIDKRMKRLFISAFQSKIFNRVLAERIDTLDRVQVGDIAKKTDTGGIFAVEDSAAEQTRCDRFEISPTGPVPGARAELADGEPGQIERSALAAFGVEPGTFDSLGALKPPGTRRALRFQLLAPQIELVKTESGPAFELTFTAPPGSYATVVTEEILKNRRPYTRPRVP